MTDLPTLLARVEAATGPDRELDGDLALAFGAVVERGGGLPFSANPGPDWWSMPGSAWRHRTTPWRLTGSVDDALALVERQGFSRYHAFSMLTQAMQTAYRWGEISTGAVLPLALLAALLRSLIEVPA